MGWAQCCYGAVLLLRSNQVWLPVVYASRAMTDTEHFYAQVEKESLAITWANKNSPTTFWTIFQVETDHKPLLPLAGNKAYKAFHKAMGKQNVLFKL